MAEKKKKNNKVWDNFNEIKEFDVVYAYFPYLNDAGERILPNKCHYCIVMDKIEYDINVSAPVLTVAYGTSSNLKKYNDNDLLVKLSELKNQHYTGLYRDTKFELDNRVPLPYTNEYFTVRDGAKDPIVGSLNLFEEPYLYKQMKEMSKKKKDNE